MLVSEACGRPKAGIAPAAAILSTCELFVALLARWRHEPRAESPTMECLPFTLLLHERGVTFIWHV